MPNPTTTSDEIALAQLCAECAFRDCEIDNTLPPSLNKILSSEKITLAEAAAIAYCSGQRRLPFEDIAAAYEISTPLAKAIANSVATALEANQEFRRRLKHMVALDRTLRADPKKQEQALRALRHPDTKGTLRVAPTPNNPTLGKRA